MLTHWQEMLFPYPRSANGLCKHLTKSICRIQFIKYKMDNNRCHLEHGYDQETVRCFCIMTNIGTILRIRVLDKEYFQGGIQMTVCEAAS